MSIESIVTAGGRFAYDRMHFSEAMKADGFVFCSGVIGTDAKGKLPATKTEEFHNAWRKIGELLGEAGCGYGDIVECTTYHVNFRDHIGEFSAIRDEYLGEPWPAWTAIGITELLVPDACVEIRVTARVPS